MSKLLVLLLITSALQFARAEVDISTCDEQKALTDLETVAAEYRGRLMIPSTMAMMSETYRTPIRRYYQAAKTCPTKAVVRKYIVELQNIGYPNEYLESVLNTMGTQHGLKAFEIGDAWDRELVDDKILSTDSMAQLLYSNIAIMGLTRQGESGLILYSVGTGSRLAVLDHKVYVATALHVLRDNADGIALDQACQRFTFHFPAAGRLHFQGSRLVLQNTETDFAICEVELPTDVPSIALTALSVSTDVVLKKDLPLITMGYNSHNKVPNKPHVERSADCRLFFDSSESRLLEETKAAYSLPTGCDTAPGDSGSPVLDKNTGKLVGIMTKTTKIKSGATSAELREMENDSKMKQALWSELSMITPITKIREVICPQSAEEIVGKLLECPGK